MPIRLCAPRTISGEDTYDQPSTMRFVGFFTGASNRNRSKSNPLFSLKYVVRPWTPIVKGRNAGGVRGAVSKCRTPGSVIDLGLADPAGVAGVGMRTDY